MKRRAFPLLLRNYSAIFLLVGWTDCFQLFEEDPEDRTRLNGVVSGTSNLFDTLVKLS